MNKLCARCGKPVYFAERKTSLGREWHPTCLKCHECGKVLAPGQHAEHKGLPYCHHPCYRALFGPDIIGFGSTASQPKTRPQSCSMDYYDHHQVAYTKNTTTNYNGTITTTAAGKNGPTTTITTTTTMASSVCSPTATTNTTTTTTTTATNSITYDATLKIRGLEPVPESADVNYSFNSYSSDIDNDTNSDNDNMLALGLNGACYNGNQEESLFLAQDLMEKVNTFNRYHQNKIHNQMSVEEKDDGNVQVRGPLRIYWGLSRPIQLTHCDDKPAAPVSKWRHSLHVGNKQLAEIPECKITGSMSFRRPHSPSHKSREMDDVLLPSSSPDDVVRRKKKGVPRFKTVAYRGDEPMKWKRASINGHIFNYDTSVFTPVLGSCTCVNVDDGMDSNEVITTLLEKFKVQNNADEYVLSLVSEEGERLLTNWDRPLLERLNMDPNKTMSKLFIKERQMGLDVLPVDAPIQMPIVEAEEEENLPQEVEQLLVLPEAVLRGVLIKYKKDEEHDVQLVRARYEAARKRILNQLGQISFKTTSTV